MEDKLSEEQFSQLISEELYTWMESNLPMIKETGFAIREWNENLWFDKKGDTLTGLKIYCSGIVSSNSNQWINIYDCEHIEGKKIKFKILDYTKSKIKLKIEGMFTRKILFIGWFPLEYIDPRVWVDTFFKNIKENFTTYEHYFKRVLIEKSPQWNKYKGDYRSRIIQIATEYGVNATIQPPIDGIGQDKWLFKKQL